MRHGHTQPTGAVAAAVLLAVCWVESKVELTPEESSVVGVDQLKHTLMDDVRLKAEEQNYELRKEENPHGGSPLTRLAGRRKLFWAANL